MKWFVAILFSVMAAGAYFLWFKEQPPPPAETAKARPAVVQRPQPKKTPPQPRLEYSELRKWVPNNERLGLGLEILVDPGASEDQLIDLVKRLTDSRDPVTIRVFSSQKAYDEDRRQTYTQEHQSGYLILYLKNLTGRGPYDGLNEIRWMQEKGHLSHKRGSRTKF